MVAHSRAPLGARALRHLNEPTEIAVQVDADGTPLAVRRPGWRGPRPVARVQDRWRVDDEWWRERAIARLYHVLLLADGALLTVFRDLLADRWYEQRV